MKRSRSAHSIKLGIETDDQGEFALIGSVGELPFEPAAFFCAPFPVDDPFRKRVAGDCRELDPSGAVLLAERPELDEEKLVEPFSLPLVEIAV
jgi:hypothetical protein